MRWQSALLAILIGGCGGPQPDVLRMGLASAPANLDPRFATDAIAERIDPAGLA